MIIIHNFNYLFYIKEILYGQKLSNQLTGKSKIKNMPSDIILGKNYWEGKSSHESNLVQVSNIDA